MIAQEVVAKALDDATRQAFEEEKRNIASQKRAAQATSINKLFFRVNKTWGGRSICYYLLPAIFLFFFVSAASTPTCANAGESSFVYLERKIPIDASTLPNADLPIDPNIPDLKDDSDAFSNDGIFNGAYDDENIIHKDHPKDQILGDPKSAVQTRGKIQKASSAQQALDTEEGIDYDKVFAPVARIEAIRLFLAFASYMGFTVYQMDVKSAFLYGTIEKEVYMIGSLMYLTASRPDIMFVVCACARFQVTPKASHLNAVKRIFSDYGGASLDRKSTTGGCQFLGRRLISWQCKKQTIMANSTTEAEYVAAANCCGAILAMDT
ncbi:uncharacterized mitochondrial protein-like protein [Tanacetum coccineum]